MAVTSWFIWALMSAFFAAVTAIFAKLGVSDVNSDVATFVRTLVIILVLGAILTFRGLLPSLSAIGPKTLIFLAISGMGTGASWLCYFRALQAGDAARVAPVDKLSVVLVAIFGVTFLGEQLTAKNWLGVIMVTAGVALLAWK